MKRAMFVAGALLAVVSAAASAHSDVGLSFGVPGAVYSAPPVHYRYPESYHAAPRVYYGGRYWDRHAYREYREHRRHWQRDHWRRDWDHWHR